MNGSITENRNIRHIRTLFFIIKGFFRRFLMGGGDADLVRGMGAVRVNCV